MDRSKICQAEASGRVEKIMGINIVKHWDHDYAFKMKKLKNAFNWRNDVDQRKGFTANCIF